MPQQTKTDNHSPAAKLALRRFFLEKYHGDPNVRPKVLDCFQAGGLLWTELRATVKVAGYWGVDLKPRPGRLKLDSQRILDQTGWDADVIDLDAYGSPWGHWFALLRHAPRRPLTVFLTVGMLKMGSGGFDAGNLFPILGLNFRTLKMPACFLEKLHALSIPAALGAALDHGFKIVECREAPNRANQFTHHVHARYFGIRLEPVKETRRKSARVK